MCYSSKLLSQSGYIEAPTPKHTYGLIKDALDVMEHHHMKKVKEEMEPLSKMAVLKLEYKDKCRGLTV